MSYLVGNAPAPASYMAPLVNFGAAAELPRRYYAGQEMARQQEAADYFRNNPIPIDPQTGLPDLNALVQAGAKIQGLPYLEGLLPFLQKQAIIQSIDRGEGSPLGAATPGRDTLNPAAAGPGNFAKPQPSQQPIGRNVNEIVSRLGGNPDDPKWAGIAQRLGVKDAEAELPVDKALRLENAIRSTTGTMPNQRVAQDFQAVAGAPGYVATPPNQQDAAIDQGLHGTTDDRYANGVSGAMPGGGTDGGGPQPGATGLYPPAPGRTVPVTEPTPPQTPTRTAQQTPETQARPAATQMPTGVSGGVRQFSPAANALVAGTSYAGRPLDYARDQDQIADRVSRTAQKYEVIGVNAQGMRDQAAAARARANAVREAYAKDVAQTEAEKGEIGGTTERIKAQELRIAAAQKGYEGITAASDQYEQDQKGILDASKAILNTPGIYTGIGAERVYDINQVRALFGDSKAAMLQAALEKATAQSVLSAISRFRDAALATGAPAGRMFQSELEQIQKSSVRLTTPLAANRFLVEWQDRLGQQSQVLAQMARNYLGEGNNYLDVKFFDSVSKYLKTHPLFTPKELANLELLGANEVPEGKASPEAATRWAQEMGLRSDDPVRIPWLRTADGSPYYTHAKNVGDPRLYQR